jgi:CRISP-associated protein Cas1
LVTTLSRPVTKSNPQVSTSPQELFPSDLKTLQRNYGDSCSKYEQLAEEKLQKSSTIIVSGIGCALRVKNDALSILPGKTHAAGSMATRTLYRGVHGISHIILLADRKGLVTLDALKWANEQDIAITVLDGHGSIIQSLSACHADARLRRAQYTASDNGKAGKISAELVKRKLMGQLETLEQHTELPGKRTEAIELIKTGLAWFNLPTLPPYLLDTDYLRTYEGRIANAYFSTWSYLPIKWEKSVKKTVPPHWQCVTERSSPLSHNHGAWKAVDVCNAILNYAYAILESQCRQALNSIGFDCSCGFLHSDVLYRDSLVYDLMELHRGGVDHLVLKLLATTTFNKGDVMSRPSGEVRFNPQLARYISASCQLPQEGIDVSAKWLKAVVMGE